jgi:hypothetical protein
MVEASELMPWLNGSEQPPEKQFLRAVDLMLADLQGNE